MKALKQKIQSVVYTKNGGLKLSSQKLNPLKESELLIKVSAAGLNRADVMQRYGFYKVPAGESKVPGIEVVGVVISTGNNVKDVKVGDRVCGVIPGGGFSTHAILDSFMAMKVPDTWSDIDAAAFPEAALTANEALIELGNLKKGKTVLIHAGTSGVGTFLVAMAKVIGAVVICTTSSKSKIQALYNLGATHVIAEEKEQFSKSVLDLTDQTGIDVLIDFLAGRYVNGNIEALKVGGRLVMAGILDSAESQVNWIPLINKRITICPLTLRMKSQSEKREVNQKFMKRWWDGRTYGSLKPIVHSVFSLSNLDDAQQMMLTNKQVGKIVIKIGKD